MAELLAVFRIMPDEPGKEQVVIEKLSTIKNARLKDTKTEPFAFGLNAIMAAFVLEEKPNALEALESELKKIGNVSDVRMEHVTRL